MSEAVRSTTETLRASTENLQAKKDRLMEDVGEVGRDVGSRVESGVQTARESLVRAREAAGERARYAADYTDQYVHENPWKSIGLAAVVGLLIGVLMSRR